MSLAASYNLLSSASIILPFSLISSDRNHHCAAFVKHATTQRIASHCCKDPSVLGRLSAILFPPHQRWSLQRFHHQHFPNSKVNTHCQQGLFACAGFDTDTTFKQEGKSCKHVASWRSKWPRYVSLSLVQFNQPLHTILLLLSVSCGVDHLQRWHCSAGSRITWEPPLICSTYQQKHKIPPVLPQTSLQTILFGIVPLHPLHIIACLHRRLHLSISLNKPLKGQPHATPSSIKTLDPDHLRHRKQCLKRGRGCHRPSQHLWAAQQICSYVIDLLPRTWYSLVAPISIG